MPEIAPDSTPPRVSVVAIGRNEGERLHLCLSSIIGMNYPISQLEIIYVDSNSTDGSVELASRMGVQTISLSKGPSTAARGRNAGWKVASSAFVFFLDGDTILDPDFLAQAMPHFDDPKVTGIWGIRKESDPQGSIYNSVFDLDWGVSESFGGDAIVRREALEAVKGYNENLIAGEDPEMCRRMRDLGYFNLHLPIPMTTHDLAIRRWGQYWKRSVRTGHAYAEISSMYANTAKPLWLKESRRNIVRGLAWSVGPVLFLLASILLDSPWPFLFFLAVAALVILRTTFKARGKAVSFSHALAYGVHSHLQQVPILLGQYHYRRNRWRRQKSTLIEYNTSA